VTAYVCTACGATQPIDGRVWRCGCGGLLDLPDIAPRPFVVDGSQWSLWRYRAALASFPTSDIWKAVSLGEGMTPLVPEPPDQYLKVDFLMPTLSFKDRGSAVLVAKAAEMGVARLVADSSGNAGTSIAAYAARAGIAAEVFVPAATSPAKVAQLRAHGATVRQVGGSRRDAADEAMARVEASGDFYASHVYNPLFHQGTKTFAYEIWEQLGGQAPGTVVVPAGNGTLLLGAARGFAELVAAGAAVRVPRLIAVQAARCAPAAAAWRGAAPTASWGSSVAEGIAIAHPGRLAQMLAAVEGSGGAFVTVDDAEILDGRRVLAGRGLGVEPTAAVAWAAWRSWPGAAQAPRPVVVALTGAGLKTTG